MCFTQPDRPETQDSQAGAEAAQQDEINRRRKAKGYGASLLNNPSGFASPQLGRSTLGGS